MKGQDLRGAYTAERASALSGVPKSTIHYWARNDILVPSVSPERVKLWSYPDLMGLRTIYWLRQSKTAQDGYSVPATSMQVVRRALNALRELDLELFSEERGPSVAVNRRGELYFTTAGVTSVHGQHVIAGEWLDLIAPFETELGRAPDRPRQALRLAAHPEDSDRDDRARRA
jgi:hypothetical protein